MFKRTIRFIVTAFILIGFSYSYTEDLADLYTEFSSIDLGTTDVVRQIKGEQVEALSGSMTATFNSSSVTDVFRVFSLQTSLNIMVSPSIDATITASFSDASIKDAFLAILSANNLYYLEQGNIVKIMTQDEYINELSRGYLVTKTYDASIIDLDNLATVIKPILTTGVGTMTVDSQSSRIIITDVEDTFDILDEMFVELASPPPMIEIETRIVQIEINDGDEVGVNWDVLNISDAINFNFNMIDSAGVATESMGIDGAYTFDDSPVTVDALISALSEFKDLTIVAQPSVIAINRETSWIHIGSKVPYVSSTIDSTTTGTVTSSVEFTDVGIKLTVTPVVTPDGFVMMEIEANSSTYQMEAITSTENAPRIITTELECDAVIQDGETIIIGGLIQTETSTEVKGVPFLSKIPILKYLFSHVTEVENRSELVIFLTPHVYYQGDSNISLDRISQEALDASELEFETATTDTNE